MPETTELKQKLKAQ